MSTLVKTDMHKTGKPEHLQAPKLNVLTGELTVDVTPDTPMTSTAMFFLALSHFTHVVKVRDYLSESECHALSVWCGTDYLSISRC